MIRRYLEKAMRHAHYEFLPAGEGFYGHIPEAPGVWATGQTLEECREELLEVFEEWAMVGLALGHGLPGFDGTELKVEHVA